MSCTICHYTTGHSAACTQGLAERGADQDDLRVRMDALEKKVDQLTDRVVDYAHLKKLYAESRDYVNTLVQERDELVDANRRTVADNTRLDAAIQKIRGSLISARARLISARARQSTPGGSQDVTVALENIEQVFTDLAEAET